MRAAGDADVLRYKRSRFTARLPVGHRYTRSHYWFTRDPAGLWRVGLTTFATRMLGDLVECTFTTAVGDPIEQGQNIGSIEGFKAISDLYAVMPGRFAGTSGAFDHDITVIERSPYSAGWLYAIEGGAEPESLSVHDYIHVLDATIDRMLASRREGDPRG